MNYKIYLLKSVFELLYQSRQRRTKKQQIVIFYKFQYEKGRRCVINYELDTYGGYQHISFYALSTGWEKVTETGYRSVFINYENDHGGRIPSYEKMKAYWKKYCNKAGLIMDKEVNQIGLF